MKIRLLLVCISLLACFRTQAADSGASHEWVRQYDWLTNGVKTGSLLVTGYPDGIITTAFEFKDRGRGPSISEKIHVGDSGLVTELIVSGHSYMGAAVDENFIRTCEGANWSSTLEEGSLEGFSASFYLANDHSPEHMAMLARALLTSPDHRLELLPGGTASVRALTGIEGAQLYAINGLGFDPHYIWLDDNKNLFGMSGGSTALVPAGQTSAAALMKSSQEKAERDHLVEQSERLGHELPAEYFISNVNIADVESGSILANRTVWVKGGLIASITESESEPGGEKVINGMGGYLVPGLWDMHTHTRLNQGLLHIAAGVTTVRDLGNNPENYLMIREGFDSGDVIGPHSFAAGIVEGKSPFSAPIKKLAESEREAVELVSEYAGLGYPQIKIYSSLDPGWVEAVTGQAHDLGMRVSGHIPAFMSAREAVEAGYDEIQHINMLFLNFLADDTDDTRTPLRFTLVAEQAHELDLDSEPVGAFMDLLKSRKVTIDPTVAIFDNMLRHRSGQLSPSFEMVADRFPPTVRRSLMAGRMDINDENSGRYASSADSLLVMIRKLYENGIQIVAGTDSLPGFGLHRELELYQQAGIPTAAILRLATLGASEVMGVSDVSGSIETGKHADFVLLRENPLENISAVRTPQLVFKGDRYFKVRELHKAAGIEPF